MVTTELDVYNKLNEIKGEMIGRLDQIILLLRELVEKETK